LDLNAGGRGLWCDLYAYKGIDAVSQNNYLKILMATKFEENI